MRMRASEYAQADTDHVVIRLRLSGRIHQYDVDARCECARDADRRIRGNTAVNVLRCPAAGRGQYHRIKSGWNCRRSVQSVDEQLGRGLTDSGLRPNRALDRLDDYRTLERRELARNAIKELRPLAG